MGVETSHPILSGRRAFIVGIVNEHSIAYDYAKAFRELGVHLAVTYLAGKARPYAD